VKFSFRAVSCLCFSLILGAPAFAACTLTKVTEMPLLELGAHYAVMVQIGDVTRPMIVDTGAAVTSLTLSVANELKLRPDASLSKSSRVLGIGQTNAESYMNVVPSILGFGDLVYRDRSTVVAKMDFGNSLENISVGLLGDDILSQYDVEFDFPSNKLTFYRAFGCYETFTPWTGIYSTIPFVHARASIVIDVILNEERTRAIVDTGNDGSFVSRRSLALWGVSDSEISNTIGHMSSPLNGGSSFALKMFMFDKVKIGEESFSDRIMNIADVEFPLGSANLGLDYWRTHKIWISYRNNWMFLSDKEAITTVAYPVENGPGKNGTMKKIVPTDASPTAKQMAPGETPSPGVDFALPTGAILHKSIMRDKAAWLLPVYSLGEDCESEEVPTVSFPKPPDHGVASMEVRDRHTEYPAGSPLEKCNSLMIPMIVIKYAPAPGYVGDDTITIDEVFSDGKHKVRRVDVTVD
jgi:hypothetical protein